MHSFLLSTLILLCTIAALRDIVPSNRRATWSCPRKRYLQNTDSCCKKASEAEFPDRKFEDISSESHDAKPNVDVYDHGKISDKGMTTACHDTRDDPDTPPILNIRIRVFCHVNDAVVIEWDYNLQYNFLDPATRVPQTKTKKGHCEPNATRRAETLERKKNAREQRQESIFQAALAASAAATNVPVKKKYTKRKKDEAESSGAVERRAMTCYDIGPPQYSEATQAALDRFTALQAANILAEIGARQEPERGGRSLFLNSPFDLNYLPPGDQGKG